LIPFDLHPHQKVKTASKKREKNMKTQHTFSLTFFLKKDKQTKGNAPLFAKITINGTPARLSTKKRIAIDHWNQKEQKITTQTDYNITVQEKIRSLTAEINQSITNRPFQSSVLDMKVLIHWFLLEK
jgi:integrase/recombinase XerD